MLDDARAAAARTVRPARPHLDRPLGRDRQHLDDLHRRGRLAPGQPDEAVPRRPQRDVGRRHHQHRQQLPRPAGRDRRTRPLPPPAPVPRSGADTGAPRSTAAAPGSTSPPTTRSGRARPARPARARCSACSRRRSATSGQSTASTTGRPDGLPARGCVRATSRRPGRGAASTGWRCSPARTDRRCRSARPVLPSPRLQRALTAARQRVAVTGAFDEATRTALVAYQARVGPTQTATTDTATWTKLGKGRF